MDNLRQLLVEDVRAHQTGTFPPSSFAEMLAEVHDEVGSEADTLHGRLSTMPTPARLGIGGAFGLFVGGVAMAMMGLRGDIASLELPRLAMSLLGLLVVGAVAAALALRGPHKAPLGPAAKIAAAVALGLPVISSAIPGFWEGMTVPPEMAVSAILSCVAHGSPVAVLSGAAVLFFTRWSLTPQLRVAFAGIAGGCVGFAVQQLACPGADPMHMLLGHAGLMVTGALSLVAGVFIYGMTLGRDTMR